MPTSLLLDGNSLTYRAFFALPTDLATASGQVTNAVFGFTSMLINLIRDHHPDRIVVAFDRPEPTFRHEAVPTYKGNRDETPDLLTPQFGLVREVIDVLRIPTVEVVGYEADDILATLATTARDRGEDAIVVTGDRDTYQLVEDPHIKVLYNRRGVSDYALYDEAGILERTGVTPEMYPQYAALRGDPSDNLPGVPGVGEKTAAKLLNKYGGLDGIFAALDEQTPKLRQNLTEHEQNARQNFEVMVLVRDVPDLPDLDDLTWGDVDAEEVGRLFDFLEFRTLYDRLQEAMAEQLPSSVGADVLEAERSDLDASAAVAALDGLADGSTVALAGRFGDAHRPETLEGIAVVLDAADAEVGWIERDVVDDAEVTAAFGRLVGRISVAAHDAKPLQRWFLHAGFGAPDLAIDTVLAAYLLDPSDVRYAISDLLLRYAKTELPDDGAAEGQLALGDEEGAPPSQETAREALAVERLVEPLLTAIDARDLRDLLDDIELPLVGVLARMEHLGIHVDRSELQRLHDQLVTECDRLSAEIREHAGRDLNVNSTKQLREVLFDELGLTPVKKTKTGYSTDAASLEKLRDQHPIVEALLGYREVEKLRSTYGEGLLAAVRDDDRIHATFNQTVARTGRLSSEEPNLHNIPVRTDLGREFRKAFIPTDGFALLVADYNQIELRVIAHLAEDPGLISAFESGDDIHNATARRVFDVDADDVTVEMRSKAKMVSYGLAYGMEAYGLGQRLGIPTEEAKVILDAYFEAFPAVRAYMDHVVDEAREKGFAETAFGRRRPIPELNARSYNVRLAAERQAMNAPIQGTAADIFKVALVRLDQGLRDLGGGERLILQVHDEVIVEVPPDRVDEVTELTVGTMAEAAELRVPLEVNVTVGDSWAAAKG
ncbi:MAG: DNA polymerase I [Actinomycetota bacterium]